jgi:hypothetical protein
MTIQPKKGKTMQERFSPEDRVQVIGNRKLGTCRGFDDNGYLIVKWDSGEIESYPPGNLGWFQKADTFLDDFLP